jgi:hypothetical protein
MARQSNKKGIWEIKYLLLTNTSNVDKIDTTKQILFFYSHLI